MQIKPTQSYTTCNLFFNKMIYSLRLFTFKRFHLLIKKISCKYVVTLFYPFWSFYINCMSKSFGCINNPCFKIRLQNLNIKCLKLFAMYTMTVIDRRNCQIFACVCLAKQENCRWSRADYTAYNVLICFFFLKSLFFFFLP
jgi:hypothetical protein